MFVFFNRIYQVIVLKDTFLDFSFVFFFSFFKTWAKTANSSDPAFFDVTIGDDQVLINYEPSVQE